MHLQRKFFARIEQLYEKGKPRGIRNIAKDRLSMLGPKFVQSFPAKCSIAYDALSFGTIDDFPRFADTCIWRQFFPEFGFKPAAAPHAFHKNWLKNNRFGKGNAVHRWLYVENVAGATPMLNQSAHLNRYELFARHAVRSPPKPAD